MRAFMFLCCTAVFSFNSNNVLSQNSEIKVENDIALSVDEVFDVIMDQTDYTFIYQEGIFNGLPKIFLKKGTIKTKQLLEKTLSVGGFEYDVRNEVIRLSKKANEINISSFQQAIDGKVTDEDGIGILGVTVQIKGTKVGVTTNIDGYYKITVPNPESVLIFSSLGYKLQEITVNQQTVINVALQEEASELQEVVLTGYQKLSKERATGSFVKVSQKELDDRIAVDVIDKIVSVTPGLLRNPDGQLTIRGTSTFFADRNPLIVVDGFPIGTNTLQTLNPEDVASVTVLKDAAAASIWGVRAANGVIVITTKSNKIGKSKPRISFSNFVTIQDHQDFHTMPLASVQEIVDYEYDRKKNIPGFLAQNIYTNYSDVDFIVLDENAGVITEQEARNRLNQLGQYDIIDENARHFLRTRIQQQYNLSVTGGGELIDYYFSTYLIDEKTNLIGNKSSRVNLNFKNTFKISDKFNFFLNNNITFGSQSNTGGSPVNSVNAYAYQRFIDDEGNFVPVNRTLSQRVKDEIVPLGFLDWNYNPVQDREFIDNSLKDFNARLQFGTMWKIFKGVTWNASFQYEHTKSDNVNYQKEGSYAARDIFNRYTSTTITPEGVITGITTRNFPKGGIYNSGTRTRTNYNFRNLVNFDLDLFNNGQHQLNGVIGFEVQELKRESLTAATIYGFNDDGFFGTNLPFFSVEGYSGQELERPSQLSGIEEVKNRFVSFFTNTGYTYLDKYTLTGSARLDKTNLFGQDPKFRNKPLWSVGGSWLISNEDFFKVNFINYLKLRGTHGLNGNVDRGTSPFLRIEITRGIFTTDPVASVESPANPLLRWEQTKLTNFGLDFGMFNNRISGSFELYWKNSTDLLMEQNLDPTLGFERAFINAGAISNRGLEIDLKTKILDSKNLSLDINFNLGLNKNKVKTFRSGTFTATDLLNGDALVIGEDLNSFYAYRWAGLSATGQPQILDGEDNTVEIEDDTDIGQLLDTDSDEVINVGTRIPKVYGGTQFFLNYKGFSLSSYFSYKLGHRFIRPTISFRPGFRRFIHSDLNRRWQNPGDENSTDVPALPTTVNDLTRNRFYTNANHLIENAGFVRLEQLSLGYQIPERLIQRLGISSLSFNLQATNLGNVWIANDLGLDPERPFTTKREPIYALGLRLNF